MRGVGTTVCCKLKVKRMMYLTASMEEAGILQFVQVVLHTLDRSFTESTLIKWSGSLLFKALPTIEFGC
jgi:hypothetical protein